MQSIKNIFINFKDTYNVPYNDTQMLVSPKTDTIVGIRHNNANCISILLRTHEEEYYICIVFNNTATFSFIDISNITEKW